ncbi:MAG: hypothetical protein AB7S26_25445 [Sandaracinaceae bacterium]
MELAREPGSRILAALLVVVALSGVARAEEARSVEVTVAGDAASTSAIEEVIRGLVSPLAVTLRWTTAERIAADDVLALRIEDPSVVARVWVDLSSDERALIYIANTRNDRFLVRSVAVAGEYDEVARESIGQIVESSIGALLAGGEIGVSRDAAAREVERETGVAPIPVPPPRRVAPPDPEPTRDEGPSPTYSFAALYHGEVLDDRPSLRHAPELAAAIGVTGGELDLVVWLAAQYHAPYELRGEPAGVHLDGGGVRVAIGVAYRPLSFLTWRTVIGGGVDLSWVRPEAYPWAHVEAYPPFLLAAPIGTLASTLELIVAGPFAVFAGVSADVDLAGNRFVVESPNGSIAVIDPWRVRVGWIVGCGFVLDR